MIKIEKVIYGSSEATVIYSIDGERRSRNFLSSLDVDKIKALLITEHKNKQQDKGSQKWEFAERRWSGRSASPDKGKEAESGSQGSESPSLDPADQPETKTDLASGDDGGEEAVLKAEAQAKVEAAKTAAEQAAANAKAKEQAAKPAQPKNTRTAAAKK